MSNIKTYFFFYISGEISSFTVGSQNYFQSDTFGLLPLNVICCLHYILVYHSACTDQTAAAHCRHTTARLFCSLHVFLVPAQTMSRDKTLRTREFRFLLKSARLLRIRSNCSSSNSVLCCLFEAHFKYGS